MANKSGAARLAPAPDADEHPNDSDDDQHDDSEVDLDKAVITLQWAGAEFRLPKRRGRWPVRSVREFNRGNNVEGMIAVLGGEEQWARIEAICPTSDDLDSFINYATAVVNREVVP